MSYEVTATKKRPQEFESLIGQEFVVSTLENAIKNSKIAHAYLFSGPRGVGKTSSARLLAKALNCVDGPTVHPCGVCDSCKSIQNGTSVDVIEIDGASNTSVNDVRAIKEEIMFPPQFSRYKIYIIDEVHMLSTSAFNALLKTIEEPPEYAVFIFATTELQKVPATIRSRCQQFRFQLIPQELIKNKLREASDENGYQAEDDALLWIAKESGGSMRDAYTLFDQVASFSDGEITLEKIETKLNLAGFDKITEIVATSLAGQTSSAIEALESLLSSGISAEEIVKECADFFRTLLMYKAGIRREDILLNPVHENAAKIAQILDESQIEGALKGALNLYRDIRYSLSAKFELELFVSRLSSLCYLSSPEKIVKEIRELKEDIISGKETIKKKDNPRPKLEIAKSTAEGENNKEIPKESIASSEEDKGPTETAEKESAPQENAESEGSTIDEKANSESDEPIDESENNTAIDKETEGAETKSAPLMYEVDEEEEDKDYLPFNDELMERLPEYLYSEKRIDLRIPFKKVAKLIKEPGNTATLLFNDEYPKTLIEKEKKEIEDAIESLTGVKVNLKFQVQGTPKREPSERMKALRNTFGGEVVFKEIKEKPPIYDDENIDSYDRYDSGDE